jgi:hypothetical protein
MMRIYNVQLNYYKKMETTINGYEGWIEYEEQVPVLTMISSLNNNLIPVGCLILRRRL